MKIIIVGCGKTGYTIARRLLNDGNDIVIIDKRPMDALVETLDVMFLCGNGISRKVLEEAGEADFLISAMPGDEANIVCCVTAKLLGIRYTAARIRDPEYALELHKMRKEFGINLILNANWLSALAISRLLRYPGAGDTETFSHGYIELIEFNVDRGDSLDKLSIEKVVAKYKTSIVFAIVNHRGTSIIPRGNTVLNAGNSVSILGRPDSITEFFKKTKKSIDKVKDVMIIGGGAIAYYLAQQLESHGMSVKIIEISEARCNELSHALPDNLIINGDGTDVDLLHEERLANMDALVCITDRDEENIVTGMYGRSLGISNTVVKVNHLNTDMAQNLDLGNIISPKSLIANSVSEYVLGLVNARGKNIKAAYTVKNKDGGTINILEFNVPQSARCLDTPLKDLNLKRNIIIGSIVRGDKIVTPQGSTEIHAGDIVIIVTDDDSISNIDEIIVPGEVL